VVSCDGKTADFNGMWDFCPDRVSATAGIACDKEKNCNEAAEALSDLLSIASRGIGVGFPKIPWELLSQLSPGGKGASRRSGRVPLEEEILWGLPDNEE